MGQSAVCFQLWDSKKRVYCPLHYKGKAIDWNRVKSVAVKVVPKVSNLTGLFAKLQVKW